MESERFDQIVRRLTSVPSRRELVQIIAAGATAAGWSVATGAATQAGQKKKKPEKCKPKCDKECEVCKKGKCKPAAKDTTCRLGLCRKGICSCEIGGDDCPGLCSCGDRPNGKPPICFSPVGLVVERCEDCPPGTLFCDQGVAAAFCYAACDG